MHRDAVLLSALGALGACSLLGMELPVQSAVSPTTLRIAQVVQSFVLIMAAVWVGCRYAPRVGLRIGPSADSRPSARTSVRPFGLAAAGGALASCAATVLFFAMRTHLPERFVAAAAVHPPPWYVRLLYGTFAEEILFRWGFMSSVLWMLGRLTKRRSPDALRTWHRGRALAALAASLAFAVGHLPAAAAYAGELTAPLVAYVIIGNLAFGLVAGFAFALHGLEAAMISHLAASLVLMIAGSAMEP